MAYIVFTLIKQFSDHSCPVAGGIVILDETTPIRIELFPHRLKVISQVDCVFIGVHLALERVEWTLTMHPFQYTLYPSFTQVFHLFWQLPVYYLARISI